jgi:hypothetical protein
MNRARKLFNLSVEVGAGTSDSWGFSFLFCFYDKSLAVTILHWYAYIAVWSEKKVDKK